MAYQNTPALETERLLLRRFTEDDLEAFFRIYSDKEANTFLPWYPVETMEEARAFLEERYLRAYEGPASYRYAICLKGEAGPIGYIHVETDDSHDLGYGLHPAFWHRGIATEASKAVLEQVKRDGMPYITATHDRNNPRSGQVMRQLGMHYQYSYEELWQPKGLLVTFRLYQLNLTAGVETPYPKYWNQSAVHFIEPGL